MPAKWEKVGSRTQIINIFCSGRIDRIESLAGRRTWHDQRLQLEDPWLYSQRGGLQEVAVGDTGDQGAEGEVVGAGANVGQAHGQGG